MGSVLSNAGKHEEEVIAALTKQLAELSKQVAMLTSKFSRLPTRFSLAQYNILAGYLGSNMEPWFMYGVNMPEERRNIIKAKHMQRDASGAIVVCRFSFVSVCMDAWIAHPPQKTLSFGLACGHACS